MYYSWVCESVWYTLEKGFEQYTTGNIHLDRDAKYSMFAQYKVLY